MKYIFILTLFLIGCAEDGSRGPQGDTGSPGLPGSSCTVIQLTNGALVSCTDGTSALLEDNEECRGKKDKKKHD